MAENIFLFVPNLIGYARILLALISFYYMPTHHVRTALCYIVSGFLDAVDGHAARYLGQSSRLGAMLDQLTDRCATLALVMVLGHFYPKYMFFFQLSAVIDIASHWLHLHSADLKGSKSHKETSEATNPILLLYYTSRPFLFFMCLANESFFTSLYLCHFTYGPIIPLIRLGLFQVICVISFPVMFAKTVISLVHLVSAAQVVASVDVELRAKGKAEKVQ